MPARAARAAHVPQRRLEVLLDRPVRHWRLEQVVGVGAAARGLPEGVAGVAQVELCNYILDSSCMTRTTSNSLDNCY